MNSDRGYKRKSVWKKPRMGEGKGCLDGSEKLGEKLLLIHPILHSGVLYGLINPLLA